MAMLWIGWLAMCPQDPVRLPVPEAGCWGGLALVVLGWGEAYRAYRRSTWL